MKHLHPHMRGIIYAVTGYTLWVFTDALFKSVTEYHMPTYQITFMVSPVVAFTMFLIERRRHTNNRATLKALMPKHPRNVSILSLLGFGALYLCISALAHLPLNNFYITVFTAPMTISILAYFFLKESLGLSKILAIVVGFGGVVFAEWPTGAAVGGDMIGYVAAVGCATLYAISIVIARKLTRSESALSITFFNAAQQTILSGILLVALGHGITPTLTVILFLLCSGVTSALGNLCGTMSVSLAPAASNGAYHYTQLVSGAVVAYLVWHEVPSLRLIIGAVIIVGSGIYLALHTRKNVATQQRLMSTEF